MIFISFVFFLKRNGSSKENSIRIKSKFNEPKYLKVFNRERNSIGFPIPNDGNKHKDTLRTTLEIYGDP